MMFQFCRLDFLHNLSVKLTQMKLDFKDSDLFGHQIKNNRRAKLLHLKYFKGFLNFYLFCEISFNFLKMRIFYGFLNKLLKKYEINLFFPQSWRPGIPTLHCNDVYFYKYKLQLELKFQNISFSKYLKVLFNLIVNFVPFMSIKRMPSLKIP